MPNWIDIAFLAALAVGWPIYDHFHFPKLVARIRATPHEGRLRAYGGTIVLQWAVVAVGIVAWRHANRDWASLGFTPPAGWRLWVTLAILAVLVALQSNNARSAARSATARVKIRQAIGNLEFFMPRTGDELVWFLALSVTAGFCEEFLFRGYWIRALAPWLTWWGAAALGVPMFGLLHAYQGRSGIIKTGAVGAVLTLVLALTGSIYTVIVLHALVDAGSGVMLWYALRDSGDDGGVASTTAAHEP